MSIITTTENAAHSHRISGEIRADEGTAPEIGSKPHQAATMAKGQTRRVKANTLNSDGRDDVRLGPDATELTPSAPASSISPSKTSKQDIVLRLLRQAEGATIDELMEATAWQAHSVRGFLSGTVRKKLKLCPISDVVGNGVRRYRVEPADQASGGDKEAGRPITDGFASVQVA